MYVLVVGFLGRCLEKYWLFFGGVCRELSVLLLCCVLVVLLSMLDCLNVFELFVVDV